MKWKDIDKKEQAEQFRYTLATFPEAARFIIKEKLWEGFWKYGWFTRVFTLIAILIGISLLWDIFEAIKEVRLDSFSQSISSMGTAMSHAMEDGYELITGSGSKFFMLVLLEVIVFHASRQTYRLLSGKDSKASFDHFLKAQLRMVIVGMVAWAMTIAYSIPIKIALGIFDFLEFLKPTALFLVQAFFIGYTIVDNYAEQFELDIQQSIKYAQQYFGITFAAGIIMSLLMWIPVAGPIFAPLLAAVAVTLVLYAETPLHVLGKAMYPKKKKKKKGKQPKEEELVA
jgi:CysZ protein